MIAQPFDNFKHFFQFFQISVKEQPTPAVKQRLMQQINKQTVPSREGRPRRKAGGKERMSPVFPDQLPGKMEY